MRKAGDAASARHALSISPAFRLSTASNADGHSVASTIHFRYFMNSKKKKSKSGPPTGGFVTSYVNKYTRKVMNAPDYGYKAWPFGPKKRKG
jgi:hypothetical protein